MKPKTLATWNICSSLKIILCFWYSFESSRDDSNEYQQHRILLKVICCQSIIYSVNLFCKCTFVALGDPFSSATAFWWSLNWLLNISLTVLWYFQSTKYMGKTLNCIDLLIECCFGPLSALLQAYYGDKFPPWFHQYYWLLIECCLGPLSALLQAYYRDKFSPLVSPILGWDPEVSCQRTLPRKRSGSTYTRARDLQVTSPSFHYWATQTIPMH